MGVVYVGRIKMQSSDLIHITIILEIALLKINFHNVFKSGKSFTKTKKSQFLYYLAYFK